MAYFDAHCHLQDPRLDGVRDEAIASYRSLAVERVVVNGTGPDDWDAVARLADAHSCVLPSFGLHPWKVGQAEEGWRERLAELWSDYPASGVGEIGLDRWIEDHDIDQQLECFRWQFSFAARENRPASVHCLRAWGILLEELESCARPERGFLLHSYGGSAEMIQPLANLGAYFSVSAYFALQRAEKKREALRRIPLDRLLIESDAPDMRGPDRFVWYGKDLGAGVNHPANIVGVYDFAAELFAIDRDEMVAVAAENWQRFFGD